MCQLKVKRAAQHPGAIAPRATPLSAASVGIEESAAAVAATVATVVRALKVARPKV